MNITLIHTAPIPVVAYGGTERVVWDLGRALTDLGHKVRFLVPAGSHCDFAPVHALQPGQPWQAQLPPDTDVAHFHIQPATPEARGTPLGLGTPYLVTEHGNSKTPVPLDVNTVFVSHNHAQRHGSAHAVPNGLDWRPYGAVDWAVQRQRYHFLGKASWRVKNLKGAMAVALKAGQELDVLGGDRLQLKRGLRWTWSRRIHFHGMVGGRTKLQLLNRSKGLIFPVRWHEPFGLAVIESLYFGCPVFSTPYGALPELVTPEVGHLATQADALAEALLTHRWDARAAHHRASTHFTAQRMAQGYLRYYERVLAGETLHPQPPQALEVQTELPWA